MHESMQEKLLLAICSSLLSIEGIQKELMKAPVSRLLYRYMYCSVVSADTWAGMDPVSSFEDRSRVVSLVSADNS